ncbi:hypothetical protein [Cylindrospermopsis raciborskii]|uniref:hypothetical protein n=1 Tax=Cylindrospermopsis raciborskii TaxID=77022 RepID=UPI001BACAF1C|nr:hypothetical protein [Cylindrospermopsis raciborskii]
MTRQIKTALSSWQKSLGTLTSEEGGPTQGNQMYSSYLSLILALLLLNRLVVFESFFVGSQESGDAKN